MTFKRKVGAALGDTPSSKNVVLVAALAQRSMSQNELAEKVGRRYETISRIVNGHTRPSPETRNRIADAIGVSADTLFGGAR